MGGDGPHSSLLCVFNMEKQRLWGDPVAAFLSLKGDQRKEGDWLFNWKDRERTRGKGFKLKEMRFRLDVRKMIFTVRVVRPWHVLPL